MKNKKPALVFILLIHVFSFQLFSQSPVMYDIVLKGGRVIDPETKLDAIRNVGIINNRIAQISIEPLNGKQEINASPALLIYMYMAEQTKNKNINCMMDLLLHWNWNGELNF